MQFVDRKSRIHWWRGWMNQYKGLLSRHPDWAGAQYGLEVYRYAQRWADKIEDQMAMGFSLESCADQLSHDADTDGITGFMYGAAVSILAGWWEAGEQLRVWHNDKYNHRLDGVVNPALLTIKVPDDLDPTD